MNDYVVSTPLGEMVLFSDGTALCGAYFKDHKYFNYLPCQREPGQKSDLLERAAHELMLYFAGKLREFTVPLRAVGTPFQQRVWTGIAGIAWGRLLSYGQLAAGLKTGARAVGSATGRNPISIFIPCHRVVGYSGAITGYGGGLDRKRALLTLEGVVITNDTCSEA